MASIRRISIGDTSNVSKLSQEVESIGRQLNPSDQNTVSVFQNTHGSLRNNGEERITLSRDFLSLPPLTVSPSELAEDIEDSYRKNKAEIEGRLNGPLSFNQLKSAERFIEEAYFLLPIEYKNEAAKQAAEYQRRQYAIDQIILEDERLTEVSQELSSPESRPDFEPLKDNITIILLKAPKQQSNSARTWFENIKSKLNHQVIFDQSSVSDADIRNALGTLNQNEQVRIYVERNYSAVHWKTITKDETKIISQEIESLDIYWDDYPLFQNIENELFLREKEVILDCNFIDYEENNPGAITPDKKRNPLNFLIEEAGWYKTSEDGEVLNPEAPVLNINYSSLLKTNSQGGLVIDDFIKALKDTKIFELLESTNNFYKIENNVLVTGNNTDSGSYENVIKPFIKYKIADKLYNFFLKTNPVLFNNSYNIKLEIGIFKQLEEEGLLKEAGDRNSNIRVFYIKDEEAGELVNKNKIVLNNYLEKYQISYKEIILSDGIETLPLEGIRSLLVNNSNYFYFTLNNLIMKRFKNKDFLLNYYYNYILEDLEEGITEEYGKTFVAPRNMIIKTKEQHFDIYGQEIELGVVALYKWGERNNELLSIFFNNESETWLNSDFHCIGYISSIEDKDNLYQIPESTTNIIINTLLCKIFPWQLIPQEFSITHDEYNENYHFTFYRLFSTLFHEQIHVIQSLGSNFFIRNRIFDNKEVLFEDEDSLEREFLLSKDLGSLDLKQKFFFLANYISIPLGFIRTYENNPNYNKFTRTLSYEDAMRKVGDLRWVEIRDEIDKNDFLNLLSEELYYFYSRFKGFFFLKGKSYINRFLDTLFKNEVMYGKILKFIPEGIAVLLTWDAFIRKFPVLKNYEFREAKHFYFLTVSDTYRDYMDIMNAFKHKIKELNTGRGDETLKSILDIFEDITLHNYVKDDYFKEEEHIEEPFRIKDIFYIYKEDPEYNKIFNQNDRYGNFREEVERNLINNNGTDFKRLRYVSRAPNQTIQTVAAPQVSPVREEPRPLARSEEPLKKPIKRRNIRQKRNIQYIEFKEPMQINGNIPIEYTDFHSDFVIHGSPTDITLETTYLEKEKPETLAETLDKVDSQLGELEDLITEKFIEAQYEKYGIEIPGRKKKQEAKTATLEENKKEEKIKENFFNMLMNSKF